MLGFKIITETEQRIWQRTINDLHEQIAVLRKDVDYHRDRAEKAMNLVLAKQVGMTMDLSGPDRMKDQDRVERLLEDHMNIFGEVGDDEPETAAERKERETIAKLQGSPE